MFPYTNYLSTYVPTYLKYQPAEAGYLLRLVFTQGETANMDSSQIILHSSLESFFSLVPYLLIVQNWRPISNPSTSFGQTGFEGSQLESLYGYLY
jgi:hypothetical protein